MNKEYEIPKNNFVFNWILKNKLAIGTSPEEEEHLNLLKKNHVKNILGLCDAKEAKWHKDLENNFLCSRIVLPDSNKNKLPTDTQIQSAFNILKNFVENDITYVHCFASIERSPLIKCGFKTLKLSRLDIDKVSCLSTCINLTRS